ncbi:hypothetical protein PUR71_21765, partial [Streptomyces sp. SP17BM10]|nr:hypothetical protein [Streptomyces sp. SP17BM10]
AHCAQAAALATARAREAAPDDAQEAPVAALERLTADWAQLERAARRAHVDRPQVRRGEQRNVVMKGRGAGLCGASGGGPGREPLLVLGAGPVLRLGHPGRQRAPVGDLPLDGGERQAGVLDGAAGLLHHDEV